MCVGFCFHVFKLAFHPFTISSFHMNFQRKERHLFWKTSILTAKQFCSDPYKSLKHPEGLALNPPTDMILKHCPDLVSTFKFMSHGSSRCPAQLLPVVITMYPILWGDDGMNRWLVEVSKAQPSLLHACISTTRPTARAKTSW